jgi:hypothetical protein
LVTVRILGWKPEAAWTDWSGRQRADLARRLGKLTALSRVEVKRLARRVLSRECDSVCLPGAADRLAAEPIRHLLEALGAEVVVEGA